MKGFPAAGHFPGMSGIFLAFLLLTDEAAIRKAIATFNHTYERASVLTRDATIPDFARCWQQERSQMYFEAKEIRRLSPNTVEVDARGNRYGGMIGKQTAPAVFMLKREGTVWKIDSLRVSDDCLGVMR